jgi:Flp pilus assembly protein TadG
LSIVFLKIRTVIRGLIALIDARNGNFTTITAIAALPLLIAVGTAIDYGNMVRIRGALQSALDAATMQIALEVASGKTDAELETYGNQVLLANLDDFIGASGNEPELTYNGLTTDTDGAQAVSATVSYDYKLMIIGSVNPIDSLTMQIGTKSKVRWADSGEACVLALSTSAARAIDVSGSAAIDMDGCLLVSKSTDDESIYVGGSASIKADCAEAAGTINATAGLTMACSSAKEKYATPADKFAGYSYPPKPMSLSSDPSKSDTTLSPGRYKDLTLDGTKALAAGTYYIEGSLSIKGNISGSGVMFFMADGKVSVNGSASLDLSGPTSGTYQGMVFVSAQSNSNPMTFNGTGTTNIDGIIYSPKGNVTFSGNNSTTSNCMRVVASTVALTGDNDFKSDCQAILGDNEVYASGQLYFSE